MTLATRRIESLNEERRGRLQQLYMQHADAAGRLAFLLTQDRELADDLVQDAFVRLARTFVHLRYPDAFPYYLRKTIINLARSHFRRRALESNYLRRSAERESTNDPNRALHDREALARPLRTLSPRQRTAIVLRFYEDLSVEQTAELMGCSAGTVKTLVSRALERLREVIERE